MNGEELKQYFLDYYAEKPMTIEADKLKEELKEWKKYREKIKSKELTSKDFNSSNENFKSQKAGDIQCSLREFVENRSNAVGYLGMMKSSLFPIWVEKDTNTTWDCRDGEKKKSKLDETAAKGIMEKVCEFLDGLLKKKTLEGVYTYLEQCSETQWFRAPAFLVKLVVLNSLTDDANDDAKDDEKIKYKHQLFGIYKYDGIQRLDVFSDLSITSDENPAVTALKKSETAVKLFNEAVGADNKIKDAESFCRAQRFVWELGNPDDAVIASEATPNIIFYGAPGTGKTYAVTKALDALPNVETKFVQFHPGFTYEDFIEGIKPVGTDENGNLKFDVVNGVFKDFCIAAKNEPEKQYYFVADEVNRANLSAVFGETLSLLEPDYRFDPDKAVSEQLSCLRATPLSKVIQTKIEAQDDEETRRLAFAIYEKTQGNKKTQEVLFGVPKNIHFIGMMNDVDKSIDTFDLALRRRFLWIRKDFDPEALHEILLSNNNLDGEEAAKYIGSCQKLNNYISGCNSGKGETLGLGKAYEFGHAFFRDVAIVRKSINKAAKERLFDTHLAPTLREYCRSFLSEAELDTSVKKARDIFCHNDTKNTTDVK